MDNVNVDVCFTGQHKEMVLPLIDFFEIKINSHLNLMQPDQTLASLTSTAIDKIDKYIREAQPDIVFVQGDTTTASCAATAAFYNRKKVAHVEAGLRTGKISEPFPEEFNRRTISIIADIHYAPTETAKTNLLKEGVEQDDV